MGHSFGGILQIGYVDRFPEAIVGMIFINCTLSLEESFGNSWLPKAIELAGKDVPAICLDPAVSLYNRMIAIMPLLNEKGLMWKLFFAKEESSHKMNDTYKDFDNWNNSFSEIAMEIDDYWHDYRDLTQTIHKPVLFFYGTTDWAIGPDHYRGILFPDMITWGYDGSHMPFLEGRQDLIRAILYYKNYYQD